MSRSCRVAPAATFSRLPVARLSSTCTSSPRASSASTTCEPMKPAPPVTIARTRPYPRRPDVRDLRRARRIGQDDAGRCSRAALEADGREVVLRASRAATPLGEEIRELVLHGATMRRGRRRRSTPARGPARRAVIRPALERGDDVLCDRYLDSLGRYQGTLAGSGSRRCSAEPRRVGGLVPGPDVPAPARPGGRRPRASARSRDRIEREDADFHQRVADGYREARRAASPERVVVLDASPDPDAARGAVLDELRRRCLSRRRRAPPARAAVAEGPAHAYLLHGPPGVGKRAVARSFAAELLGDQRRVERGTHPDLYVLEALGDQIRIDEIRALRRDLHMRPFEATGASTSSLGATC